MISSGTPFELQDQASLVSDYLVIMRISFAVFAFFFTLIVNAQNYLISFAGAGLTNTVSVVKVENVSAGISLTLTGSDVLGLTGTVGVSQDENRKSSDIKIFPNPMIDNSTLEIFPPVSGNAVISIVEMNGKLAAQFRSYLDKGRQAFRLSGLSTGLYLISVKGNVYQYSGKLLCIGNSSGTISVEKISSDQAFDEDASKLDAKGTQATVYMAYSSGDILKFTGTSGNYSYTKIDIPTQDKTIVFNFLNSTDGDDNNYPMVEVGTQIWLSENLKTTRYLNGDIIGTTTPSTLDISDEITPKYQWACGDSETNVSEYGRLYTWYAITDNRKVCPAGWHVPSYDEWTILTDYLTNYGFGYGGSGDDIAKSMAATSNWTEFSDAGTIGNDQARNNSSGFSALPSGDRYFGGIFTDKIGDSSYWWSSSEYSDSNAWYWITCNSCRYVYRFYESKKSNGGSVRCIRD